MRHLVSSNVMLKRIATWISQATPINTNESWTETRQAIDIGNHTYLIENGQVFPCAHCGKYDRQWSSVEVLSFFEETYGAKPYDITVEVRMIK